LRYLAIFLLCGAAVGCNRNPHLQQAASTPDGANGGDAAGTDGADAHPGPDADSGSSPAFTVNGRIVDPWGQPMSGFQVLLGGTTTVTDGNGSFTFSEVTAPYDVAFLYPGVPNTTGVPEVWQFRGLTRSAPTLQPIRAMGPHRADLYVDRTNVPTPAATDGGQAPVVLGISVGSPDFTTGGGSSPLGSLAFGLSWSGPAALIGTMHGLAWTQSPSSAAAGTLQNAYLSYQAVPVTVTEVAVGSPSQHVTLDFSPNDVQTAVFQATLQSSWGEVGNARTLHGLVVFDSNASIEVAQTQGDTSPATMTTTMPLLPESHVVFVGFQSVPGAHGTWFGASHREATSPGVPVVLDVPEPRTLTSPPEGAQAVDRETTFEWSSEVGAAIFSTACAGGFQVNVVTTESAVQLPSFPALGMALPAGAACLWHVEVHGAHSSVDDATGPAGIADPCFYDGNCERTSLRGSGTLTISDARAFQTAP
jgi:hypothetical protein